jgi:hypothetical protein
MIRDELYLYAKHFQLVMTNGKVFDWNGDLLIKRSESDYNLVEIKAVEKIRSIDLISFIIENIPAH